MVLFEASSRPAAGRAVIYMATVHAPFPIPPQVDPLLSFGDWLRLKANIVTLPAAIAFASLAFNIFNSRQHLPAETSSHVDTVLHCLHAFLILILFFAVPPGFRTDNSKYEGIFKAAKRFRIAWQLTLLAWFALYGSFIVYSLGILPPYALPGFKLLEDVLSCLSTVGFWFCFVTVSNPDQRGDPVRWVGVLCCVLVVDLLGTVAGNDSLIFMAKIGISALSGVALAFFVGRLESRLLRPPRWLLGALYAYAVLQFGYAFIESQPKINQAAYFFVALSFKILLALFVSWLISTGNLLFYLHYMSELNQDYSEKRAAFLADILASSSR